MKAYLITTGVIFFLLTLSHAARIYVEETLHLKEPIFLGTTIAFVGMTVWAIALLKKVSSDAKA